MIYQVETAVRFLANPRVATTTEELKRSFLSKKGLTQEEIGLAMARAAGSRPGPPAHQDGLVVRPGPTAAAYPPTYVMQPTSVWWSFFRII